MLTEWEIGWEGDCPDLHLEGHLSNQTLAWALQVTGKENEDEDIVEWQPDSKN